MIEKIINFFSEDYKKNLLNIEFGKWIAASGHAFYWFLWTYILPQPYDSTVIRFTAIGLFVPFLFRKFFPKTRKIEALLDIYWYICLCYNLPFLFTYLTLMNDFSGVWLICETMGILMTIILAPRFIMFVITFGFGVISAYLLFLINNGSNVNFTITHLEYLLVIPMVIIGGIAFNFSAKYGEFKLSEQKNNFLKSLGGSIAHELRGPLSTINLIYSQITDLLRESRFLPRNIDSKDINSYKLKNYEEEQEKLKDLTIKISKAVDNANNIINVILGDLSEKEIKLDEFKCLVLKDIIYDIADNYGYKTEDERSKVIINLNPNNDFTFKAVPERFTFIIYNLLKNALYYLKDYPNSIVTIGAEQRDYEGENYNAIYVQDTGPGIPANIIPKLFGDFYTSGKKGGTGLGLAFCKRNMIAFGGNIICESELGKWTKFSLLFPILSEKELKQANIDAIEAGKKKILIVDDEQVNLLIEEAILEKNLNIICNIAKDGSEAVNMVRKNYYDHEEDNRIKKYEFVLMDLEMPVMDGFEAMKEIRKLRHDIPLIAYSSLTDAKEKAMAAGADGYFVKPTKKELLSKIVAKWIGVKYDPLKNKSLDDLKTILQNKKVLLADDEATNLMMLAKYIEKFGAVVEKVGDGEELVEKYKASFLSNSCHSERSEESHAIERDTSLTVAKSDCKAQDDRREYDLIITDINMHKLNGDEATVQIRKYEEENNLKQIPIIAFTGDSETEKLHHFFNVGISDYFVKGDDNEYLVRIMAFWVGI